MPHLRPLVLFSLAVLAFFGPERLLHGQEPKILEVRKIWDQGKHNAFTDLIRWRNKWYCVFREALGHVGGDGQLRVLESTDGQSWSPVGLVEEKDIDLRDPHLSITADDRLMIVAGGSVYKGTKTLLGRQPRVSFSSDGRQWTAPKRVLSEGEWLWRVTWHQGRAYGVSYNALARQTKEAKEAEYTVYVTGEVGKPGAFVVPKRPPTIMQALALAGGLGPFASERRIQVIRKAKGEDRIFEFNYRDYTRGRDMDGNITLRTGDVVVVPERGLFQ